MLWPESSLSGLLARLAGACAPAGLPLGHQHTSGPQAPGRLRRARARALVGECDNPSKGGRGRPRRQLVHPPSGAPREDKLAGGGKLQHSKTAGELQARTT